MGFVVTLVGYAPPARADEVPFVKARIQEATERTGAYATIETQNINAGSDPEHPDEVMLTTYKGTLAEGWYRVVWIDSLANETAPTAPVQNLSQLAGGVRPTVTDVANLLRARTKITGGREVGTFDANTRPTSEDVDGLIDEAVAEVLGKVRVPEEGSNYERRTRSAIALYTAILVELGYFPEQINSGRSPEPEYRALYESRVKALIAEGETGEVQGEGGDQESPADAAWAFPVGGIGLPPTF